MTEERRDDAQEQAEEEVTDVQADEGVAQVEEGEQQSAPPEEPAVERPRRRWWWPF